jgi:hypothetical protein
MESQARQAGSVIETRAYLGKAGHLAGDAGASHRRVSCWGDSLALLAFRDRVTRAFNARPSAVTRIARVMQTDSGVRLDVYYSPGQGVHVRERMQRFAGRWGWYLRAHRPYCYWIIMPPAHITMPRPLWLTPL